MVCNKCQSLRIISISCKCSDMFSARSNKNNYEGYVPSDVGLGSGGDHVSFAYCLECGQMQGNWPKPKAKIEKGPTCPFHIYQYRKRKWICLNCKEIGSVQEWGFE